MHWRAQCHTKWQMQGRRFQHSSGIEPMSPDSLLPVLTTKPLVCINGSKKTVHDPSYFATCNWFFCRQGCHTRIFQVEYHGQTRNTRILERKPLIRVDISYCIRHRLELKYFTSYCSHKFCSMLIKQLINLEKVGTDNLKISKIEARPVNAGHYMAFKHLISFATDLAANFGCDRIGITPDIVSKLLRAAIWSRCAVRFESGQMPMGPISRIGRLFREFQTCCFAQDSILNMLICSYVIFLLRDQWMIKG